MAGDWLKWSVGLTRKPEVLKMAARLMIPPTQAAGTLMLVMEWLDSATGETDYDDCGNANVTLGALPINFIDSIAGVTGFSDALAEVGWLKKNGDIALFVNAGRHNGKTAKTRILTKQRVAKLRDEEVKRSCNAENVTVSSLLSNGMERDGGETKEQPITVIPLLLSTEEFRSAWADWLQHRKEKRSPVRQGSQAEKQQLKTLESLGAEKAIQTIRFTIFKGWTGLRVPEEQELLAMNLKPSRGSRPDIYTEPFDWRTKATARWPDHTIPETWAELPSHMRNELIFQR